jgi:hypothetical protein
MVSMQRPAPGGNVRSADADTETISATAILVGSLSPSVLPGDCDGGWLEPSTYDFLFKKKSDSKSKVIERAETKINKSKLQTIIIWNIQG